jgi:quercetin dioxygenase-like cupin family protein
MGCGIVTKLAEQAGIQSGVNILEDVSKNFEGAGVSVKMTPLKAGLHVIQHKHEYDHLSVLLSGKVKVTNDSMTYLIDATVSPKSLIIEAGEYHSVYALTDAVWLCVHKTGVQ